MKRKMNDCEHEGVQLLVERSRKKGTKINPQFMHHLFQSRFVLSFPSIKLEYLELAIRQFQNAIN